MRNKIRSALLLPFVILICRQAVGQTADATSSQPVSADYTVKTGPREDSVRDSSSDTKSSNQWGAIVNYGQAGINGMQAQENWANCDWHTRVGFCVRAVAYTAMAVANVAQAKADEKVAGQASGSMGATDTGGGNSADQYNAGGNGSGDAGYDVNAYKINDDKLKATEKFIDKMTSTTLPPGKAFAIDPNKKTITGANGKTYNVSDFSSPSAMAAAGMSKASIDALTASQKLAADQAIKNASKYKLSAGATSEEASGGSGGSGKAASAESLGGGSSGLGKSAGGLGIDRTPTNLAGMQKNYNGEPIGVAGDSIFKMMTRRYKVKESQRSFYDESELLQK